MFRYIFHINTEELAILYHLACKILSKDYRYVMKLVKGSLIKMHKSSKVFRGNVRRLQAFCLIQEYKVMDLEEDQSSD